MRWIPVSRNCGHESYWWVPFTCPQCLTVNEEG